MKRSVILTCLIYVCCITAAWAQTPEPTRMLVYLLGVDGEANCSYPSYKIQAAASMGYEWDDNPSLTLPNGTVFTLPEQTYPTVDCGRDPHLDINKSVIGLDVPFLKIYAPSTYMPTHLMFSVTENNVTILRRISLTESYIAPPAEYNSPTPFPQYAVVNQHDGPVGPWYANRNGYRISIYTIVPQIKKFDIYRNGARTLPATSFCAGDYVFGDTYYKNDPEFLKRHIIEWEARYSDDPDTPIYGQETLVNGLRFLTRENRNDPTESVDVTFRVRLKGGPIDSRHIDDFGYSFTTYRGPWSEPQTITLYPKPPQINLAGIDSQIPLTDASQLINTNADNSFAIHHIHCAGDETGKIVINKLNSMDKYWLTLTGGVTKNYPVNFKPTPDHPFEIDHLAAGNYELLIETINPETNLPFGCASTQNFTIKQPPPVLASSISKLPYHGFDISCAGNADGRISVTPRGGITPYEITLKGFTGTNPTPVIQRKNPELVDGAYVFKDVLPATGGLPLDYKIAMKDGGGCVATDAGPLRLNALPKAIGIGFTDDDLQANHNYNIRCHGSTNDIEVAITEGTGEYSVWLDDQAIEGDILQRIDGITPEDAPIFSNLSAGRYTIHALDLNGCVATKDFEFKQPEKLSWEQSELTPIICVGSTGAIRVNGIGGVPLTGSQPYKYTLTYNGQAVEKTGDDVLFDNLTSGTYTLTLSDANTCELNATYVLPEPAPFEVDLDGEEFFCAGQTVTLDAGNPGATYQWTSTNGDTGSDRVFTATTSGTYTVTATNAQGCRAQSSRKLTFGSDILKADFIASSEGTTGDTVVLINISFPLPDSAYWTFPEGVQVVESSDFVQYLVFSNPGTYTFTLSATKGACFDQFSDSITIFEAEEGAENPGGRQAGLISAFTIHPNPSSGKFTIGIQLREAADVAVDIFSNTGGAPWASYHESGSQSYEISAAMSAPTGVYYVVLRAGNEKKIRRIVIYK